jgi:hypothetical protein
MTPLRQRYPRLASVGRFHRYTRGVPKSEPFACPACDGGSLGADGPDATVRQPQQGPVRGPVERVGVDLPQVPARGRVARVQQQLLDRRSMDEQPLPRSCPHPLLECSRDVAGLLHHREVSGVFDYSKMGVRQQGLHLLVS